MIEELYSLFYFFISAADRVFGLLITVFIKMLNYEGGK